MKHLQIGGFEYRSVQQIHHHVAPQVYVRNDGSAWWIENGVPVEPISVEFNQNGNPFIPFPQPGRKDDFKVWMWRTIYELFRGEIPADHEVIPMNQNRGDLRPENLVLKPRGPASGGLVPRGLLKPPKLGPVIRVLGIEDESPQ